MDLRFAAKAIDKTGKDIRKAVGLGLFAAAVRGVSVIQNQIIPSRNPQPVDRGIYRAGWRARPLKRGGQVVGGEIYNTDPNAGNIELGVRAGNVKIGRAMIDALTEWAMRKGMANRYVQTASTVKLNRKTGRYAETAAKVKYVKKDAGYARGIAWAIAQSMKRRGIFGPVGLRVLGELMHDRMPSIAAEEIAREVGNKSGGER